MFFSDLFGMFY